MFYQILCQGHLKEVSLAQKRDILTPQNLTTLELLQLRRDHMNMMMMKQHSIESLVEYVFTLHLKACDHTQVNFKFHGSRASG